MKKKKLITFTLVSAGVILIDQITKWVVKTTMDLHQSIKVIGDFFTISYILNSGIAFGLFKDRGIIFIIVPLIAVVAIAADKAQQIAHPAYRRIQRFRLGKRQVALLRPVDACS